MGLAVLATTSFVFAKGYNASSAKRSSVENVVMGSATSSMMRETGAGMNASATSTRDREEAREMEKKMGQGEMHRSAVAQFVQTLLDVADKMGDLGDEVRTIAQEQANSSEKVSEAAENVARREWITTFLIGSDYKNLGMIRSELSTTENRIERLTREMERMASSTEKTAILSEIQTLRDEQSEIEAFVEENENKFSIFGWAVRLFQK